MDPQRNPARPTAPLGNEWGDTRDEDLALRDNVMSPEKCSPEEIRANDLAAAAELRRSDGQEVHASLKFYQHDPPNFWRGPADESGAVRAERLRAKKRLELRQQSDTLRDRLPGAELQYASSLFTKCVHLFTETR